MNLHHKINISTKDYVQELALKHRIYRKPSRLDNWAQKINELVGNDSDLDETEWLIVALQRAEIITGREATRFQVQYLRERQI